MKELRDYVRSIPDFPQKGVIFRDITTVIGDADGFRLAVDTMTDLIKDIDFDVLAGLEARGFIMGAPIAYNLNKPYILIRKKGKLPWHTVSESYDLEYGKAEIEIHTDSIKPGQRVVLVDDLIATGGTLEAGVKLVERLGGEVACIVCMTELPALRGRDRLRGYDIRTAISFDGE